MTPEELRALIALGESLDVEFKRDELSDQQLIETVVCLANGAGGWILLGVGNDGTIVGLRKSFDPQEFVTFVQSHTQPPLAVQAQVVELDSLSVAAIYVPKQQQIIATSDGKYLRRAYGQNGPECKPLYPYEIPSRLASIGNYDFSAQPIPGASWEDLDPIEFERLRRSIAQNPGADQRLLEDSDRQIARALNLIVEYEGRLVPTVTGLLLVGKQDALARHLPAHEAAFQVSDANLNLQKNEFTRVPLIKLFELFGELFSAYNPEEELRSGVFRIDVPRFPPEAFREAMANALVHRDYAMRNATYVQISERSGHYELTIRNPGGFPEGVNAANLLWVGPKPRNPTLADAFKRIGLAERRGRGIERIFREVLSLGRRPPDYTQSTATEVKVVFYGGPADAAFLRVIQEVQERTGQPLDIAHLLSLWNIRERGEVTPAEAMQLLSADSIAARRVLEDLLDLGLIEARGQGRGRKYFLGIGVATALGRKTAYTRRSGIARERQEAIVLEHAKKHGRVTRKDVLLLFPELSEGQATRLLEALVKEGKLRAKGRKGGKHYVLP